jgi:hypothetical protein
VFDVRTRPWREGWCIEPATSTHPSGWRRETSVRRRIHFMRSETTLPAVHFAYGRLSYPQAGGGDARAPVGPACSGSGNDQGVASISRCGVRRNTCTTPLPRPALWQCLGLKSFKGMPLKRHLSFRGWLTVKCSGSCGPYHAAKFAGMMRKSVGKYHEFKLISFRSRLFFELQF